MLQVAFWPYKYGFLTVLVLLADLKSTYRHFFKCSVIPSTRKLKSLCSILIVNWSYTYYTSNESLLNKLSCSIKYSVYSYVYKDSLDTKRWTLRVALWWYQGCVIPYNRLFSKQKFSQERQKLKFEELNFQRLQISKNFN